MNLRITITEEIFVPGPASRNTKAAPGDKPFNISAAAKGVDDVAQM